MSNWAKLQEDTIQLPVFKRAKHGIHFKNNDGSITANFSGKPCHFQDTDGLWKPIDTKLLPLGDGYYGCPHSKVKVHPDGTAKIAGTDYVQYTQLPSGQTGLLDGDKLVRKFAFGEQRLWITEDGFRSEIQLNRVPTLTEARKLIATESGTLSKEYLKSLTTATDANGDVHTYSTLSAFRTWLAQAQFPVVIDPDFGSGSSFASVTGTNADYATARATGLYIDTTSSYIQVGQIAGYEINRGVIKYDTSSIGASSTITQVNQTFVCIFKYTPIEYDELIIKCDWSGQDPVTTSNKDTVYDLILSSDQDDSIWRNSSGMSTNTQYTSGNLSTSWINKTGTTYYGVICYGDYAGTAPGDWHRIRIASVAHATESYRPVLTVTYTASGIAIPVAQYYYNRLRRN